MIHILNTSPNGRCLIVDVVWEPLDKLWRLEWCGLSMCWNRRDGIGSRWCVGVVRCTTESSSPISSALCFSSKSKQKGRTYQWQKSDEMMKYVSGSLKYGSRIWASFSPCSAEACPTRIGTRRRSSCLSSAWPYRLELTIWRHVGYRADAFRDYVLPCPHLGSFGRRGQSYSDLQLLNVTLGSSLGTKEMRLTIET